MKNKIEQNELIPKRWLMLAGGPESFGGGDEPEEQVKQPSTQEQRSQLADLAGQVESDQGEQNEELEGEQAVSETVETEEDAGESLGENVEKTLGRTQRQMDKFDPNNPTEGALMQKVVEETPEEAAVDQLDNEELTKRWENDLVALTRSQVQEIEPGAMAG